MATQALNFPITAENKTARVFSKIKGDIGGITSKLGGMKSALVGMVAAAGFGVMAKNVLDTADKIHKLNIRLGATPEALSELRHAAGLSGVSFEALTMSMQRGSRRIAEAAQGTGAAAGALEELGLDAGELAKLKPEDQLNAIADGMQGVSQDSDKVRLAMAIFGREGVSLLQMMTKGSAGLQEMRKHAADLGLTLSQDDVDAAAGFNDSLSDLKGVFEAIVTQITIGVAPALTTAAEKMTDWYVANKDMIRQNAAAVFNQLKITFDTLWPVIKSTAEWFYKIVDAAAKAAAAVAVFFERRTLSDERRNSIIDEAWNGGGQASAPAPGSAAAIAAAGGGEGFTGADAEAWTFGQGGGGATIVNNFNGQYSRNDVANIAADQARAETRQ
jgi:hypothetical protein